MSKTEKKPEAIRLKKFRNAVGLKQEDFALPLGLLQGSYSDVERGKTSLTVSIIQRLISKYKLNPYWLFIGEGPMFLEGDNDQADVADHKRHYGKSGDDLTALTRRLDMMEGQINAMRGENEALKKVISLLEKR